MPQSGDFSLLFSPFDIAARRRVIVAISGGSDSTALLILFRDYLARCAPQTRPVAATVDHALRENSAQEAEDVRRLCNGIGVEHLTLRWVGDKPATGLSAAARQARHDLLADAARAYQTDLVLLGHTADDQAETVLMRMERSDDCRSARGLAGIAPATLFEGDIWFARPLLGTMRAALRAFLARHGVNWNDDPSNADPRFERSRMRKSLAEAEDAIAAALKLGKDAARRREELGRQAASLIEKHADRPVPGILRLSPEFTRTGPHDAVVYALRILLAIVGGTPHLPDDRRTVALYERLAAGPPFRAVLSRTLVDCRKANIFLLRELRGLPPVARHSGIWDERYRVIRAERSSHESEGAHMSGAVPDSLLKLAATGQPLLVENQVAIPLLAPWTRYLPSFDISPARASAQLVGAGKIPDPPFREHD